MWPPLFIHHASVNPKERSLPKKSPRKLLSQVPNLLISNPIKGLYTSLSLLDNICILMVNLVPRVYSAFKMAADPGNEVVWN